jgi:hypothetical protein
VARPAAGLVLGRPELPRDGAGALEAPPGARAEAAVREAGPAGCRPGRVARVPGVVSRTRCKTGLVPVELIAVEETAAERVVLARGPC